MAETKDKMSAEEMDSNRDRIFDVFKDTTIFITGGTGFLGKVFIEKVLRIMDISKMFVLIRTKKGMSPAERFDKIFSDPLFDSLKKLKGKQILDRICLISGDCSELKLGLSDEDRQLITTETDLIFHCAATIRFDADLKPAVLLNVRGTKLMIELAAECKKLKFYCHMSTAYCHLNERVLYEVTYPPPVNPHTMIKTCELMSQDVINSISKQILKDWPNTYAFTKCLAEGIVSAEMDKLPIVILRPSIIMPIWLEPIPGWTDNLNGPMGLLIAAGKGVLRTMYCMGDAYADYVPVDIVVNSMLVVVYHRLKYEKSVPVYNVTSSGEYKITFREIIAIGKDVVSNRLPFNGVFWFPGGDITSSRLRHRLAFFFHQWVPAVLVDILLVLLRYPPVLKRVQRRILKGYEVFEYYTNKQWDFDNDESIKSRKIMNKNEKALYRLDGEGMNYEEYFYNAIRSARLYILNESDESIPNAKRHMKILWWVDKIWMTILRLGMLYLIWKMLEYLFL